MKNSFCLIKWWVDKMKTIETGAGVSTILFAMKNTAHTCIVPDDKLVERD